MKIFKNKENLLILVLSLVLVVTLTISKVVADSISANDIPMKDNPSTTMKSRLDALASKSRPTTCPSNAECISTKSWNNVSEGDYVQMTPNPGTLDSQDRYATDTSKTGYSSVQYIYPKELKLWRVIRKNTDGTIDMVSEYVPSTKIGFKGSTGYANFVEYLNTLASQYENPEYTIGSRHMGYNGQTTEITNKAAFDGTWDVANNGAPWTSSTTSTANQKPTDEDKGAGDTLYTTDVDLVNSAIGTIIARNCVDSSCSGISSESIYYLASRYYKYTSSNYFYFYGRYVANTAGISTIELINYATNWNDKSNNNCTIRPIVTLKSGLSVSNAPGTKEHPFVLG